MSTAIVVGGGPAGSVSAFLLARAGWDVTLFESQTFPREKVCGECLSGLGIEVLERCGLAAVVRALRPVILTRSLLHPADGPTIEVELPRPSWGVTRLQMDEALLNAAARAGVKVHQPARIESIDEGPAVRWRDLKSNRVHTTPADRVVVADGKGVRRKSTGDLGVKARFELGSGPGDAIELFAGPGFYGGVAPVEDGRWNAAFGVPAKFVRSTKGNLDALLHRLNEFNPKFAARFAGAMRVGDWVASPLPRYGVDLGSVFGTVAVGNAAAALEPVGGEGMGLAIRSAELAVASIVNGASTSELAGQFRDLWTVRRMVCRTVGRVFSTPPLTALGVSLVTPVSDLPRRVVQWIGK